MTHEMSNQQRKEKVGNRSDHRLSPYRARPYRGENSGPGEDDHGELDTQTRN
jgi:hypothetical protein